MTHICLVCFAASEAHPSVCYEEGCSGENHWPALCCPGCYCGSYEEAHWPTPNERPGLEVSDDAPSAPLL